MKFFFKKSDLPRKYINLNFNAKICWDKNSNPRQNTKQNTEIKEENCIFKSLRYRVIFSCWSLKKLNAAAPWLLFVIRWFSNEFDSLSFIPLSLPFFTVRSNINAFSVLLSIDPLSFVDLLIWPSKLPVAVLSWVKPIIYLSFR